MEGVSVSNRSPSRSRARGSYPNLHQLSSIEPLRKASGSAPEERPSDDAEIENRPHEEHQSHARTPAHRRSYLDVKVASTASPLSHSNSTARLRIATSLALSSSKSTAQPSESDPLSSSPTFSSSSHARSNTRKRRKGKVRTSDEETPYFLQRVGSAIGLDLREGAEMGGLWLGDGSSSSADLQTYTRRIDSEDTDTNVRVYLPELKSISSRPISRTTSQVPSRAQTRHHSRRPTATLPTLDDRDSPMFSLSRPLTRSSATSGGSGYDSSPDMYRDMVPDFVNKEDKAYFERVRQEAREEEESGMTSDDPEDDEEIRRIRGGGKGLGIEKIVDRMVGVTLFDPEDECDDNNKVRERRDPKLLQRKKVQPEQPQVDGWTNPAWLLSFAAKVVM